MNINKNANTKIDAFKVSRNGNPKNALNLKWDPIFKDNYNYVGGCGNFLYELFCCIYDLGPCLNENQENNIDHFSGFAYVANRTELNKIKFRDYEESFSFEMNFDDFLRVSREFNDLDSKKANEIWFKIIDDKIIVEGVWLNNNSDHK